MRRLIAVVVIGVIAWQGWDAYQARAGGDDLDAASELLDLEAASDPRSSPYQCDGRTHCSQITSCEEAEFFLANCPGVKMDGGGDGVPCEKQWCGDR